MQPRPNRKSNGRFASGRGTPISPCRRGSSRGRNGRSTSCSPAGRTATVTHSTAPAGSWRILSIPRRRTPSPSPAMYVAEFGLPDFASFDTTSLRTGMMSGAPCPVELMKRVLNEMHIRELVIAYGQTETSPVVTMSDAGDSIEIRVNTVGRAMPQTEIRVLSTTTGETLSIGEQGEICARGYAVMKGYDGDEEIGK